MLHPCAAVLPFLLATLTAQTARRVEGVVRDEAGAPLAHVRVRIESCARHRFAGVLAVECAQQPLPATHSGPDGRFALVLEPAHQRFASNVHGQFALVAEAEGRQAWRELLPSPLGLYDGSDVVLPQLTDDARATVRVVDPPRDALLRLARIDDDTGGHPPGDVRLLAVAAGGERVVHVPWLPNPAVAPSARMFARLGWTVELLAPGRTSPPHPIVPGATVTFAAGGPAPRTTPTDEGLRVARVLRRLPDHDVRWFPAPAGDVVDDPLLPAVAVQLDDGTVLGWPVAGAPPTAAAPTLRFVDTDGEPVPRVRVALHEHERLVWTAVAELRPWSPAARILETAAGTLELPVDVPPGTAAWISAPGHAPAYVWDVRAAPARGALSLLPLPETLTVVARARDGRPIRGAVVYVRTTRSNGGTHYADALLDDAEGRLPVTDAEGRCELRTPPRPHVELVAPGWRWEREEKTVAERSFTGIALVPWRARAVDAAGRPVPFTSVGCEVATKIPSGGSASYRITARADSRGIATFHEPASPILKVTYGELGSYGGKARPLSRDEVRDVHVPPRAILALRTPPTGSGWSEFVLGWRGAGRPTPGHMIGTLGPIGDGQAFLLEWPQALPLWVHAVASGPPVAVIAGEALDQRVHVLDRTAIRRRLPLRLEGDVPADLAALQANVCAVHGIDLADRPPVPGDYVARDAGRLFLAVRDVLQHELWLAHPETLPAQTAIPPAFGGKPVTAKLVRGAPCTLRVRLTRPLAPGERAMVSARTTGWFGKPLGHAELRDPRLGKREVCTVIDVPCPFALPPGTIELNLFTPLGGGATATVEVADTRPVRAELLQAAGR